MGLSSWTKLKLPRIGIIKRVLPRNEQRLVEAVKEDFENRSHLMTRVSDIVPTNGAGNVLIT